MCELFSLNFNIFPLNLENRAKIKSYSIHSRINNPNLYEE